MSARLALTCAPFPNTQVIASTRRIGAGPLKGAYRATVRTVEHSAWSTPCVSRWQGVAACVTRADAMADATSAAQEAAATGYVPASMELAS